MTLKNELDKKYSGEINRRKCF